MTLPTLVQNYKEKETVAKLKKINTVLNQAFTMAVKDYGTPDNWGYTASMTSEDASDEEIEKANSGRDTVIKILSQYMKTTSVCYFNDTSCRIKNFKPRNSLDNTPVGDGMSPNPAIKLADGSTIDEVYMSTRGDCSMKRGATKHLQNICGEIFLDINGIKPPNKQGEDLFWFRITKYGIIPGGLQSDIDSFESLCNLSKNDTRNGYACAAWVIYNENMDYLHCNDLSWNGKQKCN